MCDRLLPSETIHDDRAKVVARIKEIGVGLVAIDGCTWAGKSCLTNWIGTTQSIKTIEVDKFLNRKTGAFVRALRIDELRTAVTKADPKINLVILEGVCIRDVLEKLEITASMFIYVQRNSEMGVPCDASILDFERECEIRERRTPEVILGPELADYHRRQKPRRRADVLFIRTESAPQDEN
jgi:hypothetical protein